MGHLNTYSVLVLIRRHNKAFSLTLRLSFHYVIQDGFLIMAVCVDSVCSYSINPRGLQRPRITSSVFVKWPLFYHVHIFLNSRDLILYDLIIPVCFQIVSFIICLAKSIWVNSAHSCSDIVCKSSRLYTVHVVGIVIFSLFLY